MIFGLKRTPNSFIRGTQQVLQPIRDFCDSYVDDLATYSGGWQDHLKDVRMFLNVVRDSGLTLKLEKIKFCSS